MSQFQKPDWGAWTPSPQQPWGHRAVRHLFRRAGFGGTAAQIDEAVEQGLSQTVERMFALEEAVAFDREMEPLEKVLSSSQQPLQLASWWLLRMRQTPCPLLEKMTLFWHGHFATSADKVNNARVMLAQNRLLRQHALSSFGPLLQGISRDVAMLIYLDSTENRKTRPNENYARELMELFSLGPGNYSEKDIKEIARCFTGWEVHRGAFRFNEHQHDQGKKSFLGHSGTFSGEETVEIVLQHPAASRFIAKKLIGYFVVDDLEANETLSEELAQQLVKTNFDIGQAVRTILTSRFFYSETVIGHKVRSPVEMSIGLLRSLDASVDMNQLASRIRALGHLPLFPPNVKGWEGGRKWINASTYFGRANLVRELVTNQNTTFAGGDPAALVSKQDRKNPEKWVRQLWDLLVAVPLSDAVMDPLLELANRPKRDLNRRVSDVLCAVGAMPEFQLT